MADTHYIPGMCNINPKEISARRKTMYLGIISGIISLISLIYVNTHPIFGLSMFVPAWIGAIGYLQAKNRFCVAYAAEGKFNTSDDFGKTTKVSADEDKRKDKAKARRISLQATAFSIVIALFSVGLLINLYV